LTQDSEAVASPDDVLAFWRAAGRDKWFERDDRLDAQIRSRFLATYEAAAAGRLDDRQSTPAGTLALLILLDQFPRSFPATCSGTMRAPMRPTPRRARSPSGRSRKGSTGCLRFPSGASSICR